MISKDWRSALFMNLLPCTSLLLPGYCFPHSSTVIHSPAILVTQVIPLWLSCCSRGHKGLNEFKSYAGMANSIWTSEDALNCLNIVVWMASSKAHVFEFQLLNAESEGGAVWRHLSHWDKALDGLMPPCGNGTDSKIMSQINNFPL